MFSFTRPRWGRGCGACQGINPMTRFATRQGGGGRGCAAHAAASLRATLSARVRFLRTGLHPGLRRRTAQRNAWRALAGCTHPGLGGSAVGGTEGLRVERGPWNAPLAALTCLYIEVGTDSHGAVGADNDISRRPNRPAPGPLKLALGFLSAPQAVERRGTCALPPCRPTQPWLQQRPPAAILCRHGIGTAHTACKREVRG